MRSTMQAVFVALSTAVNAVPYALSESFSGPNFFDNFDFVTGDPSGGWVSYLDQGTAQGRGLAYASNSGVHIGVDTTSYLNPGGPGRAAVRIESKKTYNQGLFIGDFQHMPAGCGTWPAFWMYGPNWPSSGELDILEGVNLQATNQVSAHTSDGCVIAGSNSGGNFISNNCYQPVTNSGCYFKAKGAYSYGNAFNSVGGGVYAMQWTEQWLSVWFFRRGFIPANIQNRRPDPATWGRPMAMFAGEDANIAYRFANMKIVVNTDFCGGWASSQDAWGSCPGAGSNCINYVASNPGAFNEAYWSINSINIYYPTAPLPNQNAPYTRFKLEDDLALNGTDTTESQTIIPTGTIPMTFSGSSILSFSSATPLASITSVSLVDDAMGVTGFGFPAPTEPLASSTPTPSTTASSSPVSAVSNLPSGSVILATGFLTSAPVATSSAAA